MARKEETYEAKAATLNSRAEPFRFLGREFPPGEWVPVSVEEKERLAFTSLTIRQRKGGDGAKDG